MALDVGFLSKDKIERFRCATLHALLFRHYKCERNRLLTPYLFSDSKKFGFRFGRRLTKTEGILDDWFDPETDDDLAFVEFQRLRSLGLSARETRYGGYVASRVERLWGVHDRAFRKGFWDFTRLLELGATDERFVLSADYVAVDEINDLNPLQVAIVSRAKGLEVDQVGDLSQCIYGWAGVKPSVIRSLPYDAVLTRETSFRLTPPVAEAANQIIRKSSETPDGIIRTQKTGGSYVFEPQIRNILSNIRANPKAFGSVYILARTNYLRDQATELCDQYGLNLARSDEQKRFGEFISLLRRQPATIGPSDFPAFDGPWLPARTYLRYGAKKRMKEYSGDPITWDTFWQKYGTDLLRQAFLRFDEGIFRWYTGNKRIFDTSLPLIRLDTIHKSKGMEEDTAIVLADKPSRVALDGDRDEETRLAYVAVTRSKQRTFISYLDGSKLETAYRFTDVK